MTVNFPLLFVGLLLLWFPRQWFRLGRIGSGRQWRQRGGGSVKNPGQDRAMGDYSLRFSDECRNRKNYLDLVRAAVGSLAVWGYESLGFASALVLPADATEGDLFLNVLLKSAILLVGVIINFVRYDGRLMFFAPLFFLTGLTLPLFGPGAALFSFVLVWTVGSGLAKPKWFLALHGFLATLFGGLLLGEGPGTFLGFEEVTIYIGWALFMVPVFTSLLTNHSLVVFTRRH